MVKNISFVLTLVVLGALENSLIAGSPSKAAASSHPAGNAVQGKVEYQSQCAGCHDGAAAGPLLRGLFTRKKMKDKKQTPLTEATIRARITGGGVGMPPFVSLKTKQVDDLIAYLKTL